MTPGMTNNNTHQPGRRAYQPSFAKRGERPLTKHRKALLNDLLPHLKIHAGDSGALSSLLAKHPHWWLEIGYGAGEHVAGQATAHPDTGIIACEVFKNGIASLLDQIDQHNLTNVHLFTEDARLLLDTLPDACLDRVYILFPDPWPKGRHHKRRIINQETLTMLARVMKPGATLRLASDHMGYIEWMLKELLNAPDFRWTATNSDSWTTPPADHIPTRYEQKNKTGDAPIWLEWARE